MALFTNISLGIYNARKSTKSPQLELILNEIKKMPISIKQIHNKEKLCSEKSTHYNQEQSKNIKPSKANLGIVNKKIDNGSEKIKQNNLQ